MGSNRHFCRFWREIRGDRREITREGNTKFNTPQKGLQADEIYFLRCIRWRIYRLIGTACPMWWIRISFIDSAISANPRRCIYSKAARCPASERARKLGAIKLRKRMFGRTLRSEPFTPSSIPHQEDIWTNRRHIHKARWLLPTESLLTTRGRTAYRHLRPAPTAILEATPQNPVLQSAHFRQATFPPRRCRGRSTSPLFSAGKRIRRKGRCHGTAQIRRPNEVGAKDE